MPKRKIEDNFDKLYKKIKKLEKKLKRRSSSRNRSHSRSKSPNEYLNDDYQDQNQSNDVGIDQLLDGQVASHDKSQNINAEPVSEINLPTVINVPSNTVAITTSTSTLQEDVEPVGRDLEPGDIALDSAILDILGEDPTVSNNYGPAIQKDLAIRLEHISTSGLNKDLRKQLNEKYLLPENCKLINAPALNVEIKAAIPEMTLKRDKSIEIRQKQTATAISCLGVAINMLISKSNKNEDSTIIKMLMDTERILCDSQFNDSVVRRNFILSTLKKDMKEQLHNTKPDTLLFGQNLTETIRLAKAINKSGAELKTPAPKPHVNKKPSSTPNNSPKHLNWKGPFPPRKPPNQMPRMKESPRNRPQPSTSSRPSQQPPTRGRR